MGHTIIQDLLRHTGLISCQNGKSKNMFGNTPSYSRYITTQLAPFAGKRHQAYQDKGNLVCCQMKILPQTITYKNSVTVTLLVWLGPMASLQTYSGTLLILRTNVPQASHSVTPTGQNYLCRFPTLDLHFDIQSTWQNPPLRHCKTTHAFLLGS